MLPDSPAVRSLFGQLPVAPCFTLGDYQAFYGVDTDVWLTTTATGGTVAQNVNNASIDLTVTGSSGSSARLESKRQHRYQSGREMRVILTNSHSSAGNANQARRWGYGDANDAVYFMISGTTFSVNRRTSVSGSPVEAANIVQTSFNVDKLDGNGPSKATFDATKSHIYEIRFQYLGVGAVCFFVDGFLVHVMEHAGVLSTPWMKCPHQPIFLEIVNTGASTGETVSFFCANVTSQGGETPPEETFGRRRVQTIGANSEAYAFSIRPTATLGGQQNRAVILPTIVSIGSETNRASVRLLLNATLTGTSFAAAAPTGSGVDVDEAGAYSSGGVEVFFGFIPSSGTGGAAATFDLRSAFNKLGRTLRRWAAAAASCDVLTVLVTNEQAGSTDTKTHLGWAEVR